MAVSQLPKNTHIRVVLFLTILLTVFFLTNWVVYVTILTIFSITNTTQCILIGVFLSVSGLSLIFSTILGMKSYNIWTRFYSIISSVWMGYFVYLFLASVVYSLLIQIIHFVGILPTVSSILGWVIALSVIGVGTYGIFHAKKIYVKEVSVRMKNVPKSWLQRKVVWISDVHLGQIHGPAFLEKIFTRIQAIPHDIIFIGGDLFDGTSAPDLVKFLEPFQKLHPELGMYFVAGNHEEFGDNSAFISAIRSAGIRVLVDEVIVLDGVQIIGVDYHHASNRNTFKKILSNLNLDQNMPSILLKHEPKDLDIAVEAGVALQISGHTHKAQMWPLEYIPRLLYKGYCYGLRTYLNMHVYVSSGVGTWGPPMRVGTDSEIVVFTILSDHE